MFETIANEDLNASDVPAPGAGFGELGAFALSFNGYDHWGSFEKCAEIGNRWIGEFAERRALPESLTELRTCLFFEQRRWHHFGESPDGESLVYLRALVDAIRCKVTAGELD